MAERLRLAAAALVFLSGIIAFYVLADRPDIVRVGLMLLAAGASVAIAWPTSQGQAAWEFARGARAEMRKVVWPTRRETVQVTAIVIVLVLLVAIFLWFVDWVLLKGVRFITG